MGQQVGLVTNGRDAAERIRVEGWAHDYRTRDAALKSAAVGEDEGQLKPLVVPAGRGPEQFHRILETLARAELTAGLTLPELIIEASSRMPRNATVLAILGEASEETALTLGSLRRQGYAVAAVLILLNEERQIQAHGRLAAQGVEVRHINDEASLSGLCQQQLLR